MRAKTRRTWISVLLASISIQLFPHMQARATGTLTWAPFANSSNSLDPRTEACFDAHGSKFWVFGGLDNSAFRNDVIEFDTETNTTVTLNTTGDRPSLRDSCMLSYFNGDFLVQVAGYSLSGQERDIAVLDLQTRNWNRSAYTLPYVIDGAAWAVDAASRHMLIFGGWDNVNLRSDLLAVVFNSTTASVTNCVVVQQFGAIRSNWQARAVRTGDTDRFLSFGGFGSWTDLRVGQFSAADLTMTWSLIAPVGPLPPGRRAHFLVYDVLWSVLWAGYGVTDADNDLSDVWKFDDQPEAVPTWTSVATFGDKPSARRAMAFASMSHPKLGTSMLLYGGEAGPAGTGGRLGDCLELQLSQSSLLGPNLTVGILMSVCNASLFNETSFAEQIAAAYYPDYFLNVEHVVKIEARCVGDSLEYTFAIRGTWPGGPVPLPPPPPTLSGGGSSSSSSTNGSGNSGTTFNGTTWTIISWPGYTTVGTSSSTAMANPSATASVVDASNQSDSDVFVLVALGGALIGFAACLACAGVQLWKKRLDRSTHPLREEIPMSDSQRSGTSKVMAVKLLGSGNFGAVYEGRVEGTSKRIAIKEVRWGNSDEMRREANMLLCCQHEFVVQLLGVVGSNTIAVAPGCPALSGDKGSVCMLTELCVYGSLQDALLRAKSGLPGVAILSLETVSVSWLLLVFWQIAEAMHFLTNGAKVLHRDLAARNVLLARASDGYASGLADSNGLGICARISDFGLSESMYADYYDRQQGAASDTGDAGSTLALPFRWTAPEALLKHQFSEKSDVYSFGVLMIEALNMGALPLNQLLNSEVVASVQDAVHQSSPYLAAFNFDKPAPFVAAGTQEPLDEGLWALVLRCVSVRAEERPTFSECSRVLRQYLSAASTTVFVPPPRQALPVTGLLRAAEEAKYGSVGQDAASTQELTSYLGNH